MKYAKPLVLTALQLAALNHASTAGSVVYNDIMALCLEFSSTVTPHTILKTMVKRKLLDEENGSYFLTDTGYMAMKDATRKQDNPDLNLVPMAKRDAIRAGGYIPSMHNCQDNVRPGADDHMAHPSLHDGRLYYRDGRVERANHAHYSA